MGAPQAEPRLEFLGRLDGRVEASKVVATYTVEPGTERPGEWEYVFIVRVPANNVSSESQNRLAVRVPGERLRLDLQIDPDDPRSFDDRITLDGEEGYCNTLGVVSQGRMHSHAPGMTTVIFEGVQLGKRYTCTVDPGREGAPYKLFQDLELKQEHVLPPEE